MDRTGPDRIVARSPSEPLHFFHGADGSTLGPAPQPQFRVPHSCSFIAWVGIVHSTTAFASPSKSAISPDITRSVICLRGWAVNYATSLHGEASFAKYLVSKGRRSDTYQPRPNAWVSETPKPRAESPTHNRTRYLSQPLRSCTESGPSGPPKFLVKPLNSANTL
ncbi:hypothetical protein BH10ACI4_BH10ACI4_00440 [soil metagenome]